MLPHIKDVYQLCIVSYTLALMKSSEADLAYSKLMNSFSESDGKIYWSPTPITVNRLKKILKNSFTNYLFLILKLCRVRYEFNRPYLEAKDYQDNDALAVEATAYALQTIFLMEGIFMIFLSSIFDFTSFF